MIVNFERAHAFEHTPDIIRSVEVLDSNEKDEVSFAIHTNVEADYDDVKEEFERSYFDFVLAQLVIKGIVAPYETLEDISISTAKMGGNEDNSKIKVTYYKNKFKDIPLRGEGSESSQAENEKTKFIKGIEFLDDENDGDSPFEITIEVTEGKQFEDIREEFYRDYLATVGEEMLRVGFIQAGKPVESLAFRSFLLPIHNGQYKIMVSFEKDKTSTLNVEHSFMMEDAIYGLHISHEDTQTIEFSFEVDAALLSESELRHELENPTVISQLVRKGWLQTDTHEKIFPFTYSVHIENPDELPPFKYKITFRSSTADN